MCSPAAWFGAGSAGSVASVSVAWVSRMLPGISISWRSARRARPRDALVREGELQSCNPGGELPSPQARARRLEPAVTVFGIGCCLRASDERHERSQQTVTGTRGSCTRDAGGAQCQHRTICADRAQAAPPSAVPHSFDLALTTSWVHGHAAVPTCRRRVDAELMHAHHHDEPPRWRGLEEQQLPRFFLVEASGLKTLIRVMQQTSSPLRCQSYSNHTRCMHAARFLRLS